jgi:hypothetical protein
LEEEVVLGDFGLGYFGLKEEAEVNVLNLSNSNGSG